MHQPMQGAHAQREKDASKNTNRGWHLRMARSVSKAHYYVNGKSLCGRQTVSSTARLYD